MPSVGPGPMCAPNPVGRAISVVGLDCRVAKALEAAGGDAGRGPLQGLLM